MPYQIETKAEEFQLFDLWTKYKRTWYWFVISVALCCCIAMLYLMVTPKSYMRTASVLIKEDFTSTDVSTVTFGDSRSSRQSSYSNVKNEVEAFRSPQLIEEVIRKLDLTVKVHRKKNIFKKEHLYRRSPVKVSFPNSPEEESYTFQMELYPDSTYTISQIELKKEVMGETYKRKIEDIYKGRLRDTLSTQIGKIVIAPAPSVYGREWCLIPLEVSKSSINSVRSEIVDKINSFLASKDNSIVILECADNIISRAEDILNTLMEVYDEDWIREKNKDAVITSDFINDRLQLVEQELNELDKQLEAYKRANLLPNVQSATSIYMNQSSNLIVRIIDLENKLSTANYIKDFLSGNRPASTMLPSLGLDNPSIESQITRYNDLISKRDELLANGSTSNPVIENSNNTLTSLHLSITQAVDNHIAGIQLQKNGLVAQEARTTRQIRNAPSQEIYISSIEREYATKEKHYMTLLQEKEKYDMLLVTNSTNTRIISLPTGKNTPSSPKFMLVMMAAFVIGMGIPGSWIWGNENMNITIRGEQDLENLSVPLLGIISLAEPKDPKNKDQKSVALLVSEKGQDLLNETIRTVRTNLDTMCTPDKKVIMFTSFEPGPGKTFTALNLAMSMALAGKRIALLDMDMRTATLSRMISDPVQGMSLYLSGIIPEERFIIEENYFYNGFDVIPAGEIPPNPTELLMSDRFRGLIARLKKDYDYVFLDSTPLDVVTDATIVGKHADLTIFVVREGHTHRRKLRELKKIFEKKQFKEIATILNGSKVKISISKHQTYFKEKTKKVAELPRTTNIPGKQRLKFPEERLLTE